MGDMSEGEKFFIIEGVQGNIRNDGRGRLDYRTIELQTGVMHNSNGSAMIQIGETKVIAAVKAELVCPLPHSPNKGRIEISIDSTVHADLEFEGRGGDDIASDVSQILKQICNNDKLVDLEKLCIVPGVQVWVLYVDIMVIGYGGNLMDVVAIATKAALFNTKIQCSNVKYDGNGAPEIEILEDPHANFSLNVTNLPCLLTLNKIGKEFIIDATKEEEACTASKLVLAVSTKDVVLMKEMSGPGSLHIERIGDIVQVGCEIGRKLQKRLNEILEEEKKISKKETCLLP